MQLILRMNHYRETDALEGSELQEKVLIQSSLVPTMALEILHPI